MQGRWKTKQIVGYMDNGCSREMDVENHYWRDEVVRQADGDESNIMKGVKGDDIGGSTSGTAMGVAVGLY